MLDVRSLSHSGPFFGRAKERAELVAQLRGAASVSLVWGAPGIGKTRLAREACAQAAHGVEGVASRPVFFANLSEARSHSDVIDVVVRAIGATPPECSGDAATAFVASRLRATGNAILLLDGADRLATELSAVTPTWASDSTGAHVVVTARARLDLPSSHAIELEPLAILDATGGPSDAVVLLLSAANTDLAALPDTRRALAVQIAQALDGNPLALELAATRVPILGLDGLAERMEAPLGVLGGRLDGRSVSMREALERSWDQLTPAERRVLSESAVFRGSFSARAAEAVLSADAEVSIVDTLLSLRRKSLVSNVSSNTGEVRLTLTRAMREFAAGKLSTSDTHRLRGNRNAFVAHEGWRVAGEFMETGSASTLATLHADSVELLDVAEHVLERGECNVEDRRIGLRAALALEPVVTMSGPVARLQALIERGLALVPEDDLLCGFARRVRGILLGWRGEFDAARADLLRAAEIGATFGARDLQAAAMLALGALHQTSQRYDEAAAFFRSVLDMRSAGVPLRTEGRAIANLAGIANDQRRHEEAASLYEESIALVEAAGDTRMAALGRGNIGVVLQELGRRTEARARYTRAVEALRSLGDDRLLGITLGNLGMLDLEEKHWADALAHHDEARALLARGGDRRSEALAVGRRAAALSLLGRADEALSSALLAERLAAPHDGVVRGAVRLLRAFVDIAQARAAFESRNIAVADAALEAARARIREASTHDGGSAVAHSDDVRTVLRIIEPMIEALTATTQSSTPGPRKLSGVAPGTLIDKRYRVLRKLGEGGMGEVYEAETLDGARRLALKVIGRPAVLASASTVKRFEREARAAAAMSTPHSVRVVDVGRDGAEGAPFLAMELLQGEDLQHAMRRIGPIDPLAATRIAAQACLGLAEAHALGVVHRDIKPANIFLCHGDSGEIVVKILDFGIAKLKMDEFAPADSASLTGSGEIIGSPAYMSPEQVKGLRSIDHRTDVWSLGVVLYQALSGRTPFAHLETAGEILVAICSESIAPVQSIAPWVPDPIAAVVTTALQRTASRRFATAAAMLEDLTVAAGNDTRLTAEALVAADVQALATSTVVDQSAPTRTLFAASEHSRRTLKRRRPFILGIAFTLLMTFAVFGYLLAHR